MSEKVKFLSFLARRSLIFTFSVFIQYLRPKFPRCSQTKVKTIAIHYFQNNLLTTVEREIPKKKSRLQNFIFHIFFLSFFLFWNFFRIWIELKFFSFFLKFAAIAKRIFFQIFFGLFLIMWKCKEKILLWFLWNKKIVVLKK